MPKILITEDSKMFANLLKKRLADDFQIDCVIKESYHEVAELLEKDASDYMLATLDLNLPGSPNGEIVDLVIGKGIPAVVVSGSMDEATREKILEKRVLDYIMKGPHSLDLLSKTIRRYICNQEVTILLVEDSNLVRANTRQILENQHFKVVEAKNGEEAIEQLKANRSVRLVLTDYNMPKMDGFELTAELRRRFPMDKMAIIGMSAQGNPLLSAQFLKRGANDFINKPYFEEELVWRVNQNVEMLSHLERLRDAAIKDALTGLHNRRYFFEAGEKLFANALRQGSDLCIAMIDIDHFKSVNDTYGHAGGDLVIKEVAKTLRERFRDSDIVARIGGEEFVVMSSHMAPEHCQDHFEAIRQKIEDALIGIGTEIIQISVSIGVTTQLPETLDEMVREADGRLYQAKESGRNCVIMH